MAKTNKLFAGFGRVNITPPMGISVAGYFKERKADGVLDELEINAVALKVEDNTVLLITVDHCGIVKPIMDGYKAEITKKTGVPSENIFIHATHTHTGPTMIVDTDDVLINEYITFTTHKIADASSFAIQDLKPAKMGYGVSQAPGIAFVRRFRMKDGSVRTNPGVGNPDILAPIGDVDERVNVIRFARENADDIVLANFGDHPDTVGGNKISGDWPALTRATFEKAVDNTKCIFFNGAQGDVNHVKVNPTPGDFNGMFHDFDGCSRGYPHAIYMGRVVAGAIMQIYDKVTFTDVDSLKSVQIMVDIPANKATPSELPEAHRINDLHLAGRDAELPYEGMMLTTVVAEAARMVRLENAPDNKPMLFSAVKVGNVALFGIPGEPFTGIGRGIKEAEGWDLVLPVCQTNAKEGYFPMQDAYDEGGYEARSSNFKAGVAELIIEKGKKILSDLRK